MVDFFKKLDAHDFFERNGDIYIKSSYIKDFISIVLNRRLKILQLEIFNLGNNTIQPDMQNIFYSGDFNDDYYEQNFENINNQIRNILSNKEGNFAFTVIFR